MYDLYVMDKTTKLQRKMRTRSVATRASGGETWVLPASQARARFSEVVNRAAFGRQRVVLTRRGKPFAAVVPIEHLALLEEMEDRADAEDYRAALEAARGKPTVKWEDLKKELGL